MATISDTVSKIAELHAKVGSAELARRAGLPYTTVNDAAARGFRNRSIKLLERLEEVERSHPIAS